MNSNKTRNGFRRFREMTIDSPLLNRGLRTGYELESGQVPGNINT